MPICTNRQHHYQHHQNHPQRTSRHHNRHHHHHRHHHRTVSTQRLSHSPQPSTIVPSQVESLFQEILEKCKTNIVTNSSTNQDQHQYQHHQQNHYHHQPSPPSPLPAPPATTPTTTTTTPWPARPPRDDTTTLLYTLYRANCTIARSWQSTSRLASRRPSSGGTGRPAVFLASWPRTDSSSPAWTIWPRAGPRSCAGAAASCPR